MLKSTKFQKVMIIDDNQIDRYISSRMIKKHNFGNTVLEFSAANDALEYLILHQDNKEMLPEIIFVDIYMPMMSGFEFMEAYIDLSGYVKEYCRAFIISSTIDANDILRVDDNPHVVGFHQKPVTTQFLETIDIIR